MDKNDGAASLVRSDALLACSEPMLCAAMREAVTRGMLPLYDSADAVAKQWADMRACIDAALSEANARPHAEAVADSVQADVGPTFSLGKYRGYVCDRCGEELPNETSRDVHYRRAQRGLGCQANQRVQPTSLCAEVDPRRWGFPGPARGLKKR